LDIEGSIPVGRNSDVTVAKTVNPIANIAAHGKRSVVTRVVMSVFLTPRRDTVEACPPSANGTQCPEDGNEVNHFLQCRARNCGQITE
jgi:hypothetical protein